MASQNITNSKPGPGKFNGLLLYCYDAYCGWCYGFSPVIKKIAEAYKSLLPVDVLSGGMILPEKPAHISKSANYILSAYKNVEELTGIKFGEDYLWHLKNTEDSDWYPNSEKPAIAMCVFKEFYPARVVEFAADLQQSLYMEGRDLTDDEAYRHLLEKYSIQPEIFYNKLNADAYKEMAHYEFSLVKQLQVTGYPCVFIQTADTKFTMVARGYTDYETLKSRIDKVLEGMK